MTRVFDDIGDLEKLIEESVEFDQKTKNRIYNLAKSIIDHDQNLLLIMINVTQRKNWIMLELWYINCHLYQLNKKKVYKHQV